MLLLKHLKQIAEQIPYPLGRWAPYVPHSVRLGFSYSNSRALIRWFAQATSMDKERYLVGRLNFSLSVAQRRFETYRALYGGAPIRIASLAEYAQLPVLTRDMARCVSEEADGWMKINTGGSTGKPLSLFVDSHAWGREWAHMHHMWSAVGYHPSDLMLTILGRDLNGRIARYNMVHNEFRINPYMSSATHIEELRKIFIRRQPKYLHGYPSSVYSLLRELDARLDSDARASLKSSIRSCLLSSEAPLPYMVSYIRDRWGWDCYSWYGHSEMCVIAGQSPDAGAYLPMHSYGYTEVSDGRIIGTSYHNTAMPLIRYDTGDTAVATWDKSGLLRSFRVEDGRAGDFVIDRNGRPVTLTALLFGRHHAVFDAADFVQVSQPKAGQIVFRVVLRNGASASPSELLRMFDLENLNFEILAVAKPTPVRTKVGKLPLVVSAEALDS